MQGLKFFNCSYAKSKIFVLLGFANGSQHISSLLCEILSTLQILPNLMRDYDDILIATDPSVAFPQGLNLFLFGSGILLSLSLWLSFAVIVKVCVCVHNCAQAHAIDSWNSV